MEVYRVGRKIQEERNRRHISQDDLCDGICSVSTLSRIENGTQKPTLKVEEALLERLGCSTENLVFYAGEDEVAKHTLEKELSVLLMNRQPLKEKLDEYKRLIIEKNGTNIEKQFALMTETIEGMYTNKLSVEDTNIQLENAILLTIPNYKERELYSIKLLTLTELTILSNMAIVKDKQNKKREAIRIMDYLVEYLEKRDLSIDMVSKRYPMVLFNLIKMRGLENNPDEILELCTKGISFCKRYNRLINIAEFYYYKAVAHTKKKQIIEAKESYEYAICLAKILGRNEKVQQIQQEYEGIFIDNNMSNPNQQCQWSDQQHTYSLQAR